MYDNIAVVGKQGGKFSRVTTASEKTNYLWVDVETPSVKVTWTDLFINVRHKNNRWLNAIEGYHGIETKYDDRDGTRTISAIDHVHSKLCV